MWFGVITLFPAMFSSLDHGITGRALKKGHIKINYWDPRNYTENKHRTVDDRPYGGGPGMLMTVAPLQKAIQAAKQAALQPHPLVVHLSPQGQAFNQKAARRFLEQGSLILIAGRYEGIDQRLLELEVDEEWSIGDYILSGGEFAAMALIDVITRLVPGALGHEESAELDSLSNGLLKHPQYTRPMEIQGLQVPSVLMGGCHKDISLWRLKQSLGQTWLKRPDLLAKINLDAFQLNLLMEFIQEHGRN